jgi:hypothetical protein
MENCGENHAISRKYSLNILLIEYESRAIILLWWVEAESIENALANASAVPAPDNR